MDAEAVEAILVSLGLETAVVGEMRERGTVSWD
jgi:hypothetical protein